MIEAQTRPGLTGVWVEERKIASIGVGVRQEPDGEAGLFRVAPDALLAACVASQLATVGAR